MIDHGLKTAWAFCCPRCKGPLGAEPAAQPQRYTCAACAREYPIVLGIPDFRVFPDPYIDYADDHIKARWLADEADAVSFARLSERYWEITPNTPPRLAARYVRHVLGGVDRGRASLSAVERAASALGARVASATPRGAFLELGCGTGGFLVAAAPLYERVVGVDIAFRWLVLARKRIEEAVQQGDLPPEQAARIQIICCCAEYLPFLDHSFSLAVASDVIEHTARQAELVQQARRALQPGGLLFLATPNRFSLAPEPHVQVWGVGFLPRPLQQRYVRLVRGIEYENIRLVSPFDIARFLRQAGFARWKVLLPRLTPAELQRYSRAERWGVAIYHRLTVAPGFRHLLYLCGPLFHAVAVAPTTSRLSGPQVLTSPYYRRLYALEQTHGWFRGMRTLAAALLDPLLAGGASRGGRATSAGRDVRATTAGWRVLDDGCGTGSMLDWLRRFRGVTVIGADLSADALGFCRQRGHRTLAQGSVVDLPFRQESFDLVVCTDVLQHLPNSPGDAAALAEVFRVLRPGGYLYIRTNTRCAHEAGPEAEAANHHRYTREELAERLRAAGFTVERTTYANVLPSLLDLARHRLRPPASSDHPVGAGLTVRPRPPRLRWIDVGLALLLRAEAWYLKRPGRSLPFGSSLLLLAHKPTVGRV